MITFSCNSNIKALDLRAGDYHEKIKQCLSHALTQFIATYDLVEKEVVSPLSSFCDLVAYAIEMTIITSVYNIDNVIDHDFMEEVFEGEDLKHLYYPEAIKSAIKHSIRIFMLQYRETINIFKISTDQLEELADNIAYFIDIETNHNKK